MEQNNLKNILKHLIEEIENNHHLTLDEIINKLSLEMQVYVTSKE